MTQPTVFVTGSNGFIAQELVSQLLKKGYKVIGQVRSAEKGENLVKTVNNANFSYVVVPVLETKGAFDKILKDHPEIETFYHTASPVTFANDDIENKILIPAINGTKYVLQSIRENAPQLKHFVYTSTGLTQIDPTNPQPTDEDTWSDLTYEEAQTNGMLGYSGSKKFAEQEVWKFRDEFKPKFTVTTVLPVFVLGPLAFESNVGNVTSSASTFADAISSKTREEFQGKLMFNAGVDVRDVARAHIFAGENDSADGKRLGLSSGVFNADTILKILNEKFPGKTTLKANDPPVSPGIDIFNNKKTRALLGDLIPVEQSILDSLTQIASAV